jgi:hypothetical protein
MSLAKRALDLPDGALKNKVIRYLAGGVEVQNLSLKKAIYTGKSKKITSKEVFIVKKGKEKSKIRDLSNNELTVLNTQLITD